MTEATDAGTSGDRDDIARSMDRRQAECALRLQMDYGHDFSRAWLLAGTSRSILEADLRKPRPLITGLGI